MRTALGLPLLQVLAVTAAVHTAVWEPFSVVLQGSLGVGDETHSGQVWEPPWLGDLLLQGANMSSNNLTSVVSGPLHRRCPVTSHHTLGSPELQLLPQVKRSLTVSPSPNAVLHSSYSCQR